MSAGLDAFQIRLEGHFASLGRARSERGLPVFAFEHGLDPSELSELSMLLKAALRTNYLLDKHWLVWVIYATEQGYDYDGDEYWHTFERRMPLWDRGWRPALRNWFKKFHKSYGGLLPVGRWANFFSIIAWPITHALLPKDLQGQLARALYGFRYQLVSRLNQSPAAIGHYLARMTRGGSSRFDNFLEQEELVGHIVLALLDHRTVEEDSAILPQALERIVSDLEKARNARQWLHDARKEAEVARMRGTARRLADNGSTNGHRAPLEQRPAIRPLLSLRRTGVDQWTPIVEIPSFQEVAHLSPDLGEFLKRTRCSVAGSSGVRPPGWLLNGNQRRVLETWPPADAPILSFQAENASMEHLLSSECRMSPGPIWLFRIGPDGRAIEVLGRLVRPGRSYIIVSLAEPVATSIASFANLQCQGAQAIRIDLPAAITAEQIEEIKKAGLSIAQTIRVWPVGLAARGWDGEGATEWLENECPCFAIEHDHPVAEYEVRLGAEPPLKVAAKPPGVPTFVRLQPLPTGNHVLSVSVTKGSTQEIMSRLEGVISLSVRPPNPWVSGTIGHTGLIATSEPPEPTLDEFWEGLTHLSVMGPAGRQVTICVELLDGSGARMALEQVGQLTLPLGPDVWRTAFEAFERREKDPWSYLEASSGRVLVDGEELGVVRISLRRDAAPVRWVWRSTNKSTLLRLVDDHDGDQSLRASFHSFAKPQEEILLEPEKITTGIEPVAPGGLFLASYGDQRVSLIVGMRKVDGGFGGLIPEPDFEAVQHSREEALKIVQSIIAWSDARLAGALVAERRARVLSRLKERLYESMCGYNWANAERGLRLGFSHEAAVARVIQCFNKKRTFAVVLTRDAVKYARFPDHVRQREFAALAHRYAVAPGVASKPALDLTDVLDRGVRPTTADLVTMIDHLWDHPELTAGARIIQLLGRQEVTASTTSGTVS